MEDAGTTLWTATDHPEVAAFLTLREKQLALMPEVVAKPRFWIPHPPEPGRASPYFAKLPALGPLREVANALAARAMLRLQNGDFPGFLEDIRTIRLLARRVAENNTVIEKMVGIAIENVGISAAGVAVGDGKLTAEQCTRDSRMSSQRSGPLPEMIDSIDDRRTLVLSCQ